MTMAERRKELYFSKEARGKFKKNKTYFRNHTCKVPNFIVDPFDYPMSWPKRFILKFFTVNEVHYLHKTFMRSSNAVVHEKYRHIRMKLWFVVHPFSIAAGLWHIFMFIAFCFDLANAPFFKNRCNEEHLMVFYVGYWALSLSLPAFFFIGYIDESMGEIVLDLRRIAIHYVTTWFAYDVLATVPWRLIIHYSALGMGVPLTLLQNRYLRSMDMTRILLFRLGYIHLKNVLAFFRFDPNFVRICKLTFIFVCFVHWGTCLQSFLPFVIHGIDLVSYKPSWLHKRIDSETLSPYEYGPSGIYLAGLFRTVTQILSQGYGVAFPEAPEDAYFTMLVVLLGRVFYFYLIQEMLSYREWVKSPKVKYYIMMGHVNQFMRRRQLPALMQRKIRMFYEYRFQRTYFKEKQILATISDRLREEIRVHECRKLVEESRLFGALPPEVINGVTRCFKPDVYLPNDILIKVGNFGDCMFFLSRGTVAVISRSGEELAHLCDGAFFGELALISSEERRLATVIAVEISEVYRLEREDFQSLVRPLPSVFRQIRLVAEQRLTHMMEMERLGRSSSHGSSRVQTVDELSNS